VAQQDAAMREHTRLLLMYNLTPQIRVPDSVLRPLTGAVDFGRFAAHVEAAGRLLPRGVIQERVPGLVLAGGGAGRVITAGLVLAVTPCADSLLFLDVQLSANAAGDIADVLFATWQERAALRIGELPLTDWLAARLAERGLTDHGSIAFGRNVHQSVFPGRRLARRLLSGHEAADTVGPEVVTIVLRGTLDSRSGASLGIRRPQTLNNPGQTMVAHGRGVSLIVGWTTAVENAFALAAVGILNAVAAVHRVRGQAFEALELDESTVVGTVQDARALIANLSRRLADMQLDLSFSVEAYADAILIPELLVESFHSSLRSASALPEGLDNTSRIVQRVDAVLAARRADLETASQRYAEQRDKIVTAVIAVGSIIALPPALLLAFFGVNSNDVDPRHSILDVHRYGVAYALAWLPFLALAIVAVIARRRISLRVSRPDEPRDLSGLRDPGDPRDLPTRSARVPGPDRQALAGARWRRFRAHR
jgi:hypothetical protein